MDSVSLKWDLGNAGGQESPHQQEEKTAVSKVEERCPMFEVPVYDTVT